MDVIIDLVVSIASLVIFFAVFLVHAFLSMKIKGAFLLISSPVIQQSDFIRVDDTVAIYQAEVATGTAPASLALLHNWKIVVFISSIRLQDSICSIFFSSPHDVMVQLHYASFSSSWYLEELPSVNLTSCCTEWICCRISLYWASNSAWISVFEYPIRAHCRTCRNKLS